MSRAEVDFRSVQVLRVLLSGIFLVAGINHVVFPTHVAARLMESSVYAKFLFFMDAGRW